MSVDYTDDTSSRPEHDDLTRTLIAWYREDIPHVLKWRKEAREDFDYYSGDQWSQQDKNALREQGRPDMTFNRIAPLVNAVTGSEINNRREVRYIPREVGDAQANEVLTSAGEWFRDQANAEDEESDAFHDTVVAGMGWTDTRLDFEIEQDGAPVISRMDSLKMVWDSAAKKPNLEDAQRVFYVDEKPYSEAQEMFPNIPKELLHAGWVSSDAKPGEPHDQTAADLYLGTQNNYDEGEARKTCTIVECRWFERVPYYRGPDIRTGEMREYDERQVKLIQANIPGFKAVRQYKKIVKRAFIGSRVLAAPDSPPVPDGMLGWECITGFQDKTKNQFYGVVRPTKDPQRWTNKFFSQVMYLLNSQAKGGIIAERGAFDDDSQAETSWAKSDAITWAAKGSLSGQSAKIQPKPVAQFNSGFWALFNESKEAITQVTGISPEFIGTREVDQAGVLEYQRRQSSLNLLAPIFNSLRRYRKRQGKIMLFLIQNYLADGRLIRIVGDGKAEYVPLMKEEIANSEYDIIVDDAPTSPNEKERTWQILQGMLPLLKDYMTPDMALEVLKYSPLPASMVDAVQKKAREQADQPQPPSPDEIKAKSMERKAELDAQGQVLDLQAKQQSNEIDAESKAIDLYFKQQQAELDAQTAVVKAQVEMGRLAVKERQNAISAQRANNDRARSAQ
jgi:hypothetical protein